MQIDGLEMLGSSDIENLTVASGSSFPLTPNKAELFYLDTTIDTNLPGLYYYNEQTWLSTDQSSASASIKSGIDFPLLPKNTSLFYKLTGDVGLYIYLDADQIWHRVGNYNPSLSTFATSGLYSDLTNTPTNISQLNNDTNFQTGDQVNSAIQLVIDSAPEALNTLKEIADRLTNGTNTVSTITSSISNKVNSSSLSTFAFSGKYADLLNTPVEKTKLSEFSNNTGFASTTALESAVNTIKQRAIIAEANINTNVTAEVNRALDAESKLSDRLTALDGQDVNSGLAVIAKNGSYDNLLNLPVIPTTTSGLTNDLQFQTGTNFSNQVNALQTTINNKTDSHITLEGYGITDTYTAAITQAKLDLKSDKHTTLAGYGILDGISTDQLGAASTELKTGVATLDAFRKIRLDQLPNTVAILDSTGKIPAIQLPSYVNDILEFDNLEAFPITGESDKIYVATDSGSIYRWSGTIYIEISSTGSADIATRLYTPRTISLSGDATGSITFDGTKDKAIAVSLPDYYTKAEFKNVNYTKTEVNNGLNTRANILQLGIPSTNTVTGIATLDTNGKIYVGQLPDYINDVLEYDNLESFPVDINSGAIAGKIYVALDTNILYRWNGVDYTEVSSANVATSMGMLDTPRTISLDNKIIGSVLFDGSQDVTIDTSLPNYYLKSDIDTNYYTKKASTDNLNEAVKLGILKTKIGAKLGIPGLDVAGKVGFINLPSTIATKDIATNRVPFSQLPSNLATLDVNGKIPSNQLPSYVDEVIEFSNKNSFPLLGQSDKIYVSLESNLIYRYVDGMYVEISKTGTADAVTKLYTPRTISLASNASGSVIFDGSSDVSINVELPNNYSKTESNDKFALLTDVYSKVDTDNDFALLTDVYSKDENYIKSEFDSKFTFTENSYSSSEINDLLLTKANKQTTLSGYGITDGITLNQLGVASTELKTGVATLDLEQKVTSSQLPLIPLKLSNISNDISFQTGAQVQQSIYDLTGIYSTVVDDLILLSNKMAISESNLALVVGNVSAKASKATTLVGYGITDAYDTAHTYSSTQIDDKFNLKANTLDIYSQTAVNGLLNGKANLGTKLSDYGITDGVLTSKLGTALGVATLDSDGLIPSNQLPSYVDDVLEYTNLASFPTSGEIGKIYIALDSNKAYRWSGSTYVEVSSASIADATIKLTNPRTINVIGVASGSVSFDGSADVNLDISLSNYYDKVTTDNKYLLSTNVYDKTTSDGKYALANNIYDISTADGKYALIADTYVKADVYTQTEVKTLVKPRVVTVASSATPSINCDTTDMLGITALGVNITGITITGTPVDDQRIWIYIVGTAERTIAWSTSFESSTIGLPTMTTGTSRIDIGLAWNAVTSKWRCIAVA